MDKINIGFIGAGNISRSMAETIIHMDNVSVYAISSRDIKRAEFFATKYGFKNFYGSYEEMLKDEKIDLVYIATPHSLHYEHAKMSLDYGKHVLCEKAFMANYRQAFDIINIAKEKKLLITEAIWTRYMPMRYKLNEIINSGIIGNVSSLTANLGYVINNVPRIIDPSLAGGALLDVGVYPINFALMTFGDKIKNITSSCIKTHSGVDAQNSIIFSYEDAKMAVLNSTMLSITNREGVINGDKGYIVVKNINNTEEINVYSLERELVLNCKTPKQITGYEYEVNASIEAIRKGFLECKDMPHSETLKVMKIMDDLRLEWGVKYPFE